MLISIAISRGAQADLLLWPLNELLALTSSEHARHARGVSRRPSEGHPPRRRECCAAEEKIVRAEDDDATDVDDDLEATAATPAVAASAKRERSTADDLEEENFGQLSSPRRSQFRGLSGR